MTGQRSKQLALCLGLALCAVAIWAIIVRPAQTWKHSNAAAFAHAHEQAARLSDRLQSLRLEAAAMSAITEFDGVWMAENGGEATARVQAALSDLARQNGISLRAITPLRTEAIPLKSAVFFRIEAEAPLDHLVGFLRAAEYNTPVLVFEKGSIRRLSKPGLLTEQPVVFFQFDIMAAFELTREG